MSCVFQSTDSELGMVLVRCLILFPVLLALQLQMFDRLKFNVEAKRNS